MKLLAITAALILTPAFAETAAPVAVEVFSDFQCPFCARFAEPFRQLQEKDSSRASVTFRHFPLPFHADAQLAHQAAFAAAQQGKFWEMHDLIFANQAAIKREDLVRYATKVGLDMERFRGDMDSADAKQFIDTDKAEGTKRGVSGTPTFFVNGKEYSGTRTYEQLAKLVEDEQRKGTALAELPESLLSRGPVDARVTVEFFADLTSPVSRSAGYVLDELLPKYQDKVRLQFRNFPLAFHSEAALAHDAAMAAAHKGHFWEMQNYLLDHQDGLREQDILRFAATLNMDLSTEIRGHRYSARVDADVAEGLKRGVQGSPVLFVNGKRIDGVPSPETLKRYIEDALNPKLATR